LHAGDLPWEAARSSSEAARLYFARRYRTLRAQRDRTLEEQSILCTEVVRTFNWLEEREAAILQRLPQLMRADDGSTIRAITGSEQSWAAQLAAGKAEVLQVQLKRINKLHANAKKELKM
jgi:hypothetical protein